MSNLNVLTGRGPTSQSLPAVVHRGMAKAGTKMLNPDGPGKCDWGTVTNSDVLAKARTELCPMCLPRAGAQFLKCQAEANATP
jgi:hypothetical protein